MNKDLASRIVDALDAALEESEAKPLTKCEPETLPRMAYSIKETAQILGISPISVYRLIQRGKLKACSDLRHKLIPKTEIERFLKASTK